MLGFETTFKVYQGPFSVTVTHDGNDITDIHMAIDSEEKAISHFYLGMLGEVVNSILNYIAKKQLTDPEQNPTPSDSASVVLR